MKLPELEKPETYTGLYVFDFGDQVAVGYTAAEVGVLLDSERHKEGKVYRIHRALPDGTVELQGVPRERFEAEDGLFFYRNEPEEARQDFELLDRLAQDDLPPCRMSAQLARLPGTPETYVTAIIFPAEYMHDVSDWLLRLEYTGGQTAEGGVSQVTRYRESNPIVIDRRQWWASQTASRSPEEVLSTTHLAVQRRPA